MALTSNGLTDIGMGAGLTTNFHVQYETTLPNQANVIRNANALLGVVENEFTVTTGWFNSPGGKFGTGNRQVVNLNQPFNSGANNSGYGSALNLDAQDANNNATDAAAREGMLFINEWVEILMSLSGGKWNAGDSSGEALSQYCGIIRFQTGHYSYYGSWVDQWLNTHPRPDWVNQTEGTDRKPVSFGCALAFLFYLNTQLNFSINQILAAGASNLATVYKTLTGDSGDPFPFFVGLLEHVFPSSATANIPGPVSDNPYPLAQLSFWVDKNTFGLDEVKDAVNTGVGWPKAFWLVAEGFSENSFNALGVTIPAPPGPFANLAGVGISQNPATDFENAANPQAPQRIRIPFDINFTAASYPDFPATGSTTSELDASLSVGGTTVPGSNASTLFELVAGSDPYFTNINPGQNNVWYLSQDLRVFTATPAQNSNPVSGGPSFATDSVTGAFTYIQQLLAWLNSNYSDPTGTDPFNTVLPGQGGALQGDSSVTPFSYVIALPLINIYNNYNFAVARVRLRGTAGPSGAAKSVRVFFRLWSTETADTDYQTTSTYPSTNDAAGQPGSPLVGTGDNTLPFFATGNFSANTDYAAGGTNIRDIQIGSGDSTWAYYGCFLNLYDSSNVIAGRPIQQWLNGTHHCLVAQIAFDGAPIFGGATPEASDKLAQRNLQVTRSDNPGPAATHLIPQTFDVRPSPPLAAGGGGLAYPDELMIDWGLIPPGSVASIFWPQVQASDVVALASSLYASHTLSAADVNTIKVKVTAGVTYVPIPASGGENFAGLFTIELPPTVVTGQEFNVLVRRIATKQMPPLIELQTGSLPSTAGQGAKAGRTKVVPRLMPEEGAAWPGLRGWRYVVGTFQVKIPVSTAEAMLLPEENTLAIMKWRQQQMPLSSRWYRVLERYVSYIAGRVDGLGGNSGSILPSPDGIPIDQITGPLEHEYTGKVCEVLYDCFGDFEGFVLGDCDGSHHISTRHRGIEKIALRACKEQLLLSVLVEGKDDRIRRLILRC